MKIYRNIVSREIEKTIPKKPRSYRLKRKIIMLETTLKFNKKLKLTEMSCQKIFLKKKKKLAKIFLTKSKRK
jgi:hypothetical protein